MRNLKRYISRHKIYGHQTLTGQVLGFGFSGNKLYNQPLDSKIKRQMKTQIKI